MSAGSLRPFPATPRRPRSAGATMDVCHVPAKQRGGGNDKVGRRLRVDKGEAAARHWRCGGSAHGYAATRSALLNDTASTDQRPGHLPGLEHLAEAAIARAARHQASLHGIDAGEPTMAHPPVVDLRVRGHPAQSVSV